MYGFGFMVGAIMCYVFKSEWEMYDWGMMTFMLVLVGVLSFTITNALLLYLFPIKSTNKNISNIKNNQLKKGLVLLILFYQLIYFGLYYYLVLGGVSISNFAVALLDVRQEDAALPPLIQRLELFSSVFTYYMEFLMSKNIALKIKNSYARLVLIVSIVSIMGTFLSGAKGFAIYQVLFIIFAVTIIKYKVSPIKSQRVLNFKKMLKYSLLGVVAIWAFGAIADLQGRGSELGPLYYFGIYSGGGTRNLDLFVNSSVPSSAFFGEYSFHMFDDTKVEFHENRFVGGYPTGNLATAFQYYYKDFGLIGTGLFVVLIAIIMFYLYKKAILTKELESNTFSVWIFLFAYLGRGLALSFFSETFFLLFFSVYQMRTIILILLFAWLMDKKGLEKAIHTKQAKVLKYT